MKIFQQYLSQLLCFEVTFDYMQKSGCWWSWFYQKIFLEVPKNLECYWNINKQELKCSETLPCRSPLSIYRWACGFFNMSSQLGLLYLIVWSGFDVVRSFSHPLNTVWSLLICRLGKYLKVGNYRFMSNKITSWVIFFVSSHSYWF